jgi:hypothetical protein
MTHVLFPYILPFFFQFAYRLKRYAVQTHVNTNTHTHTHTPNKKIFLAGVCVSVYVLFEEKENSVYVSKASSLLERIISFASLNSIAKVAFKTLRIYSG